MREVLRTRPRGRQPRLRDGRAHPGRQLPRAQGQRHRAALPVADRRGDDHPPRALRAGLRGGVAGRPAAAARRGERRRGRRVPAPQAGRLRGAEPADRRALDAVQARPSRPRRSAPGATTAGRRDAHRGPGRGLVRDRAGRSASDASALRDRRARRRAARRGRRWTRRPTRRRPSSRRSTRSARAAGPSRCSASTTRGRSTRRPPSDGSATTRCPSCGATGSSPASTAGWTDRRARSTSSGCGWRTRRWPRTRRSARPSLGA